jgi:hypothetical protein
MPDFSIRSDSVDVEQIMEQIRARIREKRGVDYTEQQLRELAAVKLEKFLDPRGVRSDILERFRQIQAEQEPLPNYAFEATTLYETHRPAVRWVRRLLQPVLKLFFNPNPLIRALNIQARVNASLIERDSTRRGFDQLYFEVIHNLVVEITRLGIEIKNLTMRVESVASRLEFNERRARALESAVVYRSPGAGEGEAVLAPDASRGELAATPSSHRVAPDNAAITRSLPTEGPGQRSRRRRRRRGRRGRGATAAIMGSIGAVENPPAGAAAPPVDSSSVPGEAGREATPESAASSPSLEHGAGAAGQGPVKGAGPEGPEPDQR